MNTAIIIVTHNSELFLPKAMQCIREQTLPPKQVILVDTGSKDLSYLKEYEAKIILAGQEVGFCRGNNVGYAHVQGDIDYVFFLNPDAFIAKDYLEKATSFMDAKKDVGAVTGITFGYDLKHDHPSGKYDTTGIFQTRFGKWYDRSQGVNIQDQTFSKEEEVEAICGAVFFTRKKALESCLLREREVFDSTFFMYKEDIDLSGRLRKKGWKLMLSPELIAYHCRGWNPNRHAMPRKFRLCSARNECSIAYHEKKVLPMLYSSLKYILVKFLDR